MRQIALIFVGVVIAFSLAGPAYCQDSGPVLLLQQTPSEGGTITPDAGAHHYELHSMVVVTAVAKPGYQFVYWLGDVDDPMSSSTVVRLDSPKIVIAIFERVAFDSMAPEGGSLSMPLGGIFATGGDYSRGGFGNMPGARRFSSFSGGSDFPDPPDFNDFPVPVPEPASALLLFAGSIIGLRRCRVKRRYESGDRDPGKSHALQETSMSGG